MKTWARITIGAAGAASLATLALAAQRIADDRKMRRLAAELENGDADREPFDEVRLRGLPEGAQRYLRHAIAPGTPLARTVRLRARYRMKPAIEAPRLELDSHEILAPLTGFLWTARFRIGPIPFRVRDHYAHRDGAVDVYALGLLPIGRTASGDVARSSRHRLALETIWTPAALLPSERVEWSTIDETRLRVVLTIDDEPIPFTLTIDEEGRLREVLMQRHGDIGVETWQSIPYGFRVEEEASFDGFTVPSRLYGGWWYATSRFHDDDAIVARLNEARFL